MRARVVASGRRISRFRRATNRLGRGPARIEVRYRGRIGRNAIGIFHNRSAGDWYLYTTFTAIEARRAFPCFDELPATRTPWTLTLHVPRDNTALANTRAVSGETVELGWQEAEWFSHLPSRCHRRLVAFAVGPFDIVDAGPAGKNRTPDPHRDSAWTRVRGSQ